MSFLTDAAACGKRALLYERRRFREEVVADPRSGDPSKRNAFVVGAAYHKLHEVWRLGEFDDATFDFLEPLTDNSILAAVNLFRAWRGQFERDFWGRQLAVEVTLPQSDRAKDRLCRALRRRGQLTARPGG